MIQLDKGAREPLYLQVKAGLLARINSGAFADDRPLPTERELADALGLSRLTVRRSIVELAQQGLVRRIPGRGTFVVRGSARPPITLITLLLPDGGPPTDLSGAFLMHLLGGLYAAALPATVALCGAGSDVAQLRRSQGIIALWQDAERLRYLTGLGVPLVGYESASTPEAPICDNICHANESGAFAATCALINLGHRDLGCVVHATSVATERQAGFERAMRQHALAVPPGRIFPCMATGEAGYAFGRQLLLQPGQGPSALLCSDDCIASGILAAAQELGRPVPGSISLVGFGDLGMFTTPALSSVRMDIAASGREAVRLLRERAANPALPPRHLVLPTEHIRRASCGPPRAGG